MRLFHMHARRRRAQGALVLVLVGLGGLGFTFFQTQVLKNTAYALKSEANRLRPLDVPAPRGTLYDRNGEVVAENLPGYTLTILPAPADSVRVTLERLAPLLDLSESRIAALMQQRAEMPHQPLVVSVDLGFDRASAVEERRAMFPGVLTEMRPKRHYPAGEAVAHLVGYVGEISREELEQEQFLSYRQGQLIGKSGLERQYEAVLGGRPGTRYLEVDAYGRIVGEFAPRPAIQPDPGYDLRLTIDVKLQEWIAAIFPDSMRGTIVALEPRTGDVLALYSRPGFDPNDFVGGVPPELWRALTADPARPLLDRAATGLYPPGSTFKLLTATIGMRLGVVNPRGIMPIPCRGGMQYGNRYFRCWYPEGHGHLTLVDAIARSCNVYFYQLGLQIGLDRFLEEGTRLGFTQRTGVDLPVERAGNFPTEPDWYRRRFGWSPTPTEILNLAIGQGPIDQTALKMAQFYAAIAADGHAPPPRLVADGEAPKEGGVDLGLPAASLELLREGLRRVTRPRGTAHLASLEHWDLMGKTGTSQNPHGKNHGWFLGMAGPRGDEPEIVVAVLIEAGESGSAVAQYGAKVADYYLRVKHGLPVDSIQTLREHLIRGVPAPWAQWQ